DAISMSLAQGIVLAAARQGVSPPELIAAAGLTSAELAHPERRVAHATIQTLVGESVRRTADPDFGLHMAELLRAAQAALPAALHYALRSSPTVGEVARRVTRYARLISDYVEFELATDERTARFRLRGHTVLPGRQLSECALATAILWLRSNCGRDFVL